MMGLMPDVTSLLLDPDLGAQTVTVKRTRGAWQGGRFVPNAGEPEVFTAVGNLQPATSEQLEFFPEGERREGQMVFYTKTTLHLTEGHEVSDVLVWRGEEYKIINLNRWQDWGFNIAYAQKR